MAMMKYQQEAFIKLADAMTKMTVWQNEVSANIGTNVGASRLRRCFKCGSPDHFMRECPVRKAELARREHMEINPAAKPREEFQEAIVKQPDFTVAGHTVKGPVETRPKTKKVAATQPTTSDRLPQSKPVTNVWKTRSI